MSLNLSTIESLIVDFHMHKCLKQEAWTVTRGIRGLELQVLTFDKSHGQGGWWSLSAWTEFPPCLLNATKFVSLQLVFTPTTHGTSVVTNSPYVPSPPHSRCRFPVHQKKMASITFSGMWPHPLIRTFTLVSWTCSKAATSSVQSTDSSDFPRKC